MIIFKRSTGQNKYMRMSSVAPIQHDVIHIGMLAKKIYEWYFSFYLVLRPNKNWKKNQNKKTKE